MSLFICSFLTTPFQQLRLFLNRHDVLRVSFGPLDAINGLYLNGILEEGLISAAFPCPEDNGYQMISHWHVILR